MYFLLIFPYYGVDHSNKPFVLRHAKRKSQMVYSRMTWKVMELGQTYLSSLGYIANLKMNRSRLWNEQDNRPVPKTSYYVEAVLNYLEMIKQMLPNMQIHVLFQILLWHIYQISNQIIFLKPTGDYFGNIHAHCSEMVIHR